MPAIIAAIAAGGLSFGQGMLGSRSAKKQRRRFGRRMTRALNATESIQGNALGQQEALTRLATQQQLGGIDTARKEASRLGRGEKRRVLEREQQMMASGAQNLANRGLGSVTSNYNRGLAADTSRQFSGIDEGLAGIYGDLAMQRGNTEAAGSQALGGFAGQRGDLMSGLAQMRNMGDLYSSSPWGGNAALPTRENSFGQNLLGGIQTGLGTYMGMGQQQNQMMQQANLMDMIARLYNQQGDSGHEMLQGPYQANGSY
jgi:hypothetical protein